MNDAIKSLPPRFRKLAAARLRKRAEQLKEWASQNIEYQTAALKREAEKLVAADETAEREVVEWAEAVAKLKKAGFRVETSEWDLDLEVKTTRRRLVPLYKAVGRLDGRNVATEIADAEKRLVRVSMRSVTYPRLTVSFVRRLKRGDRCRIEEVEVPARKEFRLVCER